MDNIVGESVQGTHAVSKALDQPVSTQLFADAGRKIVGGGVGKCDYQDFLVRFQIRGKDQSHCQLRKRPCFPAARNRRDTHQTTTIGHDLLLGGSQTRLSAHCYS